MYLDKKSVVSGELFAKCYVVPFVICAHMCMSFDIRSRGIAFRESIYFSFRILLLLCMLNCSILKIFRFRSAPCYI